MKEISMRRLPTSIRQMKIGLSHDLRKLDFDARAQPRIDPENPKWDIVMGNLAENISRIDAELYSLEELAHFDH